MKAAISKYNEWKKIKAGKEKLSELQNRYTSPREVQELEGVYKISVSLNEYFKRIYEIYEGGDK